MNLRYVRATSADSEKIYAFAEELVCMYEKPEIIPKVLPWMRKKIAENISNYVAVYLNDTLAGYFSFSYEGDKFELDDFYVFPQMRCKGIGSCILNKCIEMAQGDIMLYVFNENKGAISLYERFGFQVEQHVSETRSIMVRKG